MTWTLPNDDAPAPLTPAMQDALDKWIGAEQAMRDAIKAEYDARMVLTQLAFPVPTEGTNSMKLPNGFKLQGMFKNNYSLENPRVEEIGKRLPAAIRQALFKWKADISVSAYKALEPVHRAIVNEILTIKPGLPALKIVEPKERT